MQRLPSEYPPLQKKQAAIDTRLDLTKPRYSRFKPSGTVIFNSTGNKVLLAKQLPGINQSTPNLPLPSLNKKILS